ncbi:MAG: ATP-binding cassette domain-containing protein [Bacteroidales bacterium]|nr:ATP-binding cassette domain-containing protein [Bacteroidales bacterium]HNW74567.1 ATP-binding cassette domain-containing protein [Bacteroidales bacterium]HPS50122.1 ATP-binding cassette domain-containing protein [Bacteroidales bacterium]
MILFAADNVTKQYSGHKALDKVSVAVPEGKIFGLLGPNGAGKTTLIRIINQIIAPDEGALMFNGRKLEPGDISAIGYLPEERGLYKKMTVGEQSLYLAQLKGLTHHEALTRLKFWFDKFEIRSWWNRKVEELSKGMQQKVQFLITIIHEPRLLIFDEPFSGFDPINASLLKDEILAQKEKGATVIFSTHNMASVEELCDDIALINKSKVVLDGSVREIKKKYKTNTYIVSFNSFDKPLESILPPAFQVLSEFSDADHRHATLKLPIDATSNDMIRLLLPHVTIYSVNERIPNMNDIFIQVVSNREVSEN